MCHISTLDDELEKAYVKYIEENPSFVFCPNNDEIIFIPYYEREHLITDL